MFNMVSERKDQALALLTVTEFVRIKTEKQNKGQACVFDLQKAFDTLDQVGEEYGFRGTFLELFCKYLNDRYQFGCWNGNHSKKPCVKTGVPQDSVLGTFCFLFYINDLQKFVMDSHMVMFADYTTIVKSGKKLIRKSVKISMQSLIDSQQTYS